MSGEGLGSELESSQKLESGSKGMKSKPWHRLPIALLVLFCSKRTLEGHKVRLDGNTDQCTRGPFRWEATANALACTRRWSLNIWQEFIEEALYRHGTDREAGRMESKVIDASINRYIRCSVCHYRGM